MTLDELVENFEFLGDWEERYRYIIELGRKLPAMPEEAKSEHNLVPGCMSRVWMTFRVTKSDPVVIEFLADSDAFIVKGLIGILLTLYSNKTPEEILSIESSEIFIRLGLQEHLSPNRRNGFLSMLSKIKSIAQSN